MRTCRAEKWSRPKDAKGIPTSFAPGSGFRTTKEVLHQHGQCRDAAACRHQEAAQQIFGCLTAVYVVDWASVINLKHGLGNLKVAIAIERIKPAFAKYMMTPQLHESTNLPYFVFG